jgi:hypothetical protein
MIAAVGAAAIMRELRRHSVAGVPVNPTALLLAVAAGLLAAVTLAGPAVATGDWQRPVPGPPLRPFQLSDDSFAAGSHRGVDLAAPPGATVRAACAGRVTFAGRVGSADAAVTLACGRWRVTHLPVREPSVVAGRHVAAGERIGSLGADSRHAGLHLGVRRDGDLSGYVDPLALLPASRPPGAVPATPPRRAPARTPKPPPGGFASPERRAPALAPDPGVAATRQNAGLAPPLAWIGLSVLLGGAVGVTGWRSRARRLAPSAQEAVNGLR